MRDLSRYVAVCLDAWPPRDGVEGAPISLASLRQRQREWRPRPAMVAARNDVHLLLDRSKDQRRAKVARLRAQVGACRAADGFSDVGNPLRGEWLLACERGQLRASIMLAPMMPSTVPYLDERAVPAGGEAPRQTCR